MATDVERLIVRLEASQAKFEKQLAKANQTANKRARSIEARFNRMNKNLSRGFSGLGASIAKTLAVAGGIRGMQSLLDSATRIDNALKVAGLSGAELEKVYDRLRDSAIKNAAPLETLVTLYGRAALVQKELNVSQEEMLNFTDKIALALRVSGQSAAESSGALLQLSQALGSGVVRAEEFNSILEGALPIAQAAAAGLEEAGGSVSKLRQLVVDGKISSEAFFRAFEAGSVILEEKVADATLTTSQGLENVRTAAIDAARDFAKGSLAADGLGAAFQTMADAINGIDFEAFGEEVRKILGWLNDLRAGIEWVQNLGPSIGAALGTDRIGEVLTGGAISKDFLGGAFTVKSSRALQSRIDNAFAQTVETAGSVSEAAIKEWYEKSQAGAGVSLPDSGPIPGARPDSKPRTVSLGDFDLPSTGGRGGSGGGRRGGRQNDLQREIEQIRERTASIQAMTAAQATVNPLIDDYGFALERATAIAELEIAAKKAGLEITPQLSEQIRQLATAYATATVESEKLAESQDNARQQADDLKDLGKDVLGGFINDLRNGVDAAEALEGALQKVADKLLDMALNNLIAGLFGGGFGGGGLLSIFGFAKGGIAAHGKPQPLPRFAKGGVARSASIFGEDGPEAAVPLPDGRRIPVDLRGPSASGSRGTSISMPITIDARDANAPALARVNEQLKEMQRSLPKQIDNRINTRDVRGTRP